MSRRTKRFLTVKGELLTLKPVFRLGKAWVVCLPPEWVEMWTDQTDMWVKIDDLEEGIGLIMRPYFDPKGKVVPNVTTLPLGI